MTYEYACTGCGHAWEAEQSISAAPLTECPSCHEAKAKRQVSGGAGFILKGGGWYADLYSSPGGAKKSEATSAAPASTTPAAASTSSSDSSASSTSAASSSTGSSSTGASSS